MIYDTIVEQLCSLLHWATQLNQRGEAVPCVFTQSTEESSEQTPHTSPEQLVCCVSWGHDQGDNQPPSWNLWGLLCSSSSALINSLCSSSWKLNCSLLPEIQCSAESFSVAFHWQRRTCFFQRNACMLQFQGACWARRLNEVLVGGHLGAYSSPLVSRTSLTTLSCNTISVFVSCHSSCSKSQIIFTLLLCSKSEITHSSFPPFE